ncbi:hypothetical protein E3T26_04330 [Cryobacterium sp. TMT1-21]|uniref:acylphosphatase n=1 Tax=Cryobacterium shii TaxID=1259235 RepID=A0AAQ2C5W4_9MICO|nr:MULTISPECIES: acylphosphatase [Cryobacterium]TFC46378.1 hypothetical protein E3O49_09650 [Cryobacterium shii]TFC89907.1 hypothetical protein E3T24_00255 [Cryobacterium sp. TmT2-59]TFD16430.1 hypothetical protein E3T26_04330 [Cryobacterium sp. TMT1-21]TFD20319.1 hypothetical protein E3T32_08930 [Cryobacterium sp. TMT2-23]TFD20728.1 hypothetical protein E3T42_01715 [Cryobacterium sp. TMT4-10]
MVRKQALVRGMVQAVGFRYYTQSEARRLGLSGFVRNRMDGSVEVDAEGDAASVSELLAWLAHGPPSAVVESMQVTDLAPRGENGFHIAY